MREHRLYQADWLLRFLRLQPARSCRGRAIRHARSDIDPKLAWALEHREHFPVDVNRADRETLLRVPGLGTRAVDRIIAARRLGKLRLDDIARLSGALARARPFIVTVDWRPAALLDDAHLRRRLAPQAAAAGLFG